MSEKIGPLVFGQKEESMFLGRSFGAKRDVSDDMALEIDREIKRLVTENYERTKRVLTEQMANLTALAEALLEKEVLDTLEIDQIVRQFSSPVAV
jgi:cell division protease FtsH